MYTYLFYLSVYYQVTRWRYRYGVGLAIYRSRVRVLAGHHCVWASY